MESITEYLAMGGYAAYVWPCYAITAIVMAVLLVTSLRGVRAQETRLQELQNAGGRNEAADEA